MEHSGWLLLSNEGLAGLAASETLLQLTCDSIAIRFQVREMFGTFDFIM